MLKKVYIKNYTLVQEQEIHFQPGLNIITGETGAGKSILIGAINTLLGERTSPSALRTGENKAIIEGVFDLTHLPKVQEYLQQQALDAPDQELILRREILANGRSRAFINDTPVTLDEIDKVASMLVDLHGQHEHQSLLRTAEHLNFIDVYARLQGEREQVRVLYQNVQSLQRELKNLQAREQELRQKKDYLCFQLEEIRKLDPQPGEEEALVAEEKRLAHSAELMENCTLLVNLLYEQDGAAVELVGRALQILADLGQLDEFFAPVSSDLEAAAIAIDEVVKSIQAYATRIEMNPERLEQIRNRLAQYTLLKKKYVTTAEGLLQKREEIAAELSQIDTLEETISELEQRLEQAIGDYRSAAVALSEKRRQAAQALQKVVPAELREMGMPETTFSVSFSHSEDPNSWLELDTQRIRAFPTGIDVVEFIISANPGQPMRPLQKVASGGEISRIMLALKKVIAHNVQIPVLIFDEIDNGISGRVAQAVGRKLRELAGAHQIICITHLPQIASAGMTHFLVEKQLADGETTTHIRQLPAQEREVAIAQLLGGEQITPTHLESARELLRHAAEMQNASNT